jgi:hypothetical protein
MTEPNTWYEINDQELFLFGTNGFCGREERIQCYRRIQARKIRKEQVGEIPQGEKILDASFDWGDLKTRGHFLYWMLCVFVLGSLVSMVLKL